MKELSLERMEEIEGGDSMDCASAAFALIAVGIGIATLPVGGWALIGATASIWGTSFFGGYSAGACFYGE